MNWIRQQWHRLTCTGLYAWAKEQHTDAMYFEDVTIEALVIFRKLQEAKVTLPHDVWAAVGKFIEKYDTAP